MNQSSSTNVQSATSITIGLDLGSRSSQCAVLGEDRKLIEERKLSTNKPSFSRLLARYPGSRVVMEASTPTRWINDLATEMGHEVIIANPRNIPLITKSQRKSDRNDARLLARLGMTDPSLLSPITLRDECHQAVRRQLFTRDHLVGMRSGIVTFIRSQVKELGDGLPTCGANVFGRKMKSEIPALLRASVAPMFAVLERLEDAIQECDQKLEAASKVAFPQTATLQQVHGIGPLTALAFVATIADPARFSDSRSVGAYLGLVPATRQSGGYNPDMRITKTGDKYMRRLLVSAATKILGPFGADSDLKRFGERIANRGGKRAKSIARIAVARKLSVLLHSLLKTGEVYEPLRNTELLAEPAGANTTG